MILRRIQVLVGILAAACVLNAVSAYAQEADTSKVTAPPLVDRPDTSAIARHDTLLTKPADSLQLQLPDSLKFVRYRIFKDAGSFLRVEDTVSIFSAHSFVWTDALYPGSLLLYAPGFYIRDLGEVGQPGSLTAIGLSRVPVYLDAVPFNDPITGEVNLYEIPLEHIQSIERLGSYESALRSGGGAAALNFVSRQYDVRSPFTKLRFLQGPNEMTLTDGIYTNNITQRANLTFGFQNITTDGRFANSASATWNVRARLRYNLSERFNLWVSEFYTNSNLRLNGGVDYVQSPALFDEVTAVVRNQLILQKTDRHDLALGMVGSMLGDSVWTTRLTACYTALERQYEQPDELTGARARFDVHNVEATGVTYEQSLRIGLLSIEGGGSIESKSIIASNLLSEGRVITTGAYGRLTANFDDFAIPSAVVRLNQRGFERFTTLGAQMQLNPGGGFTFTASGVSGGRFPTLQELYWTDSTLARPSVLRYERHDIAAVGARWSYESARGGADVSLEFFTGQISNPIQFRSVDTAYTLNPHLVIENGPRVDFTGATTSVRASVWNFTLTASATALRKEVGKARSEEFPLAWFASELAYQDVFFDGHLNAKAALRVRGADRSRGAELMPQLLQYRLNEFSRLGAYLVPDAYLVLHIGNAHVLLSWENMPGLGYFATPTYPMPSSAIRLGINWVFLD